MCLHQSKLGYGVVVSTLLLAGACSHRSTGASIQAGVPPLLVSDPQLVPNPNPAVPLAALLSVTTDVPTQVEVRIADSTHEWSVVADKELKTVHERVPILGLRPGREHTITVTVRDSKGQSTSTSKPFRYTTPALPIGFPPIQVTTSKPERMASGLTLFTINAPKFGDVLVMLDAAGEVVWYFRDPKMAVPEYRSFIAFPQPSGTLLLIVDREALLEIDMLGNVLNGWSATGRGQAISGPIPIPIDSFHHDIVPLPHGDPADFVVLSTEVRTLPNYPSSVLTISETDPEADVVGDKIVEFRRDGTIVREFKLLDLLDPYRMCYDSLGGFWSDFYQRRTRDWSHANGIAYSASDDSYLVTLRHQDVVLKLDRATGSVKWLLGDPARWVAPWDRLLLVPSGAGLAWPYHLHAPQIEPDGRMLVFDNGNSRAIPPAPSMAFSESYSRAVEFTVAAASGTVRQDWAYGSPPPGTGQAPSFYTAFAGSARHLAETGNVLICDGARIASPATGQTYARIAEVTHEGSSELVFEVLIRDASSEARSYWVYRAERIPSFYR